MAQTKQKDQTPEIDRILDDPNDTTEIVVVGDALMWNEPDKSSRRGFRHRGEMKRWRGFVPAAVAERAIEMGHAISAKDADKTPEMVEALADPTPVPDTELYDMDEATILAYIKQNPHEAYRISDLELKRTKARENVVFAADEAIARIEADAQK